MATSYASAQANGILANGTDQTSAINTLLTNAAYSGIIFDLSTPGAITVNGTLTGGNKVIQFLLGNYLTGGGTLSYGQISAGYLQQCFDTSITLTSCTTSTDRFSVMWFGAVANNATDNQSFFQKSSDTVIANTTMTRDLYLPPGEYKIDSPWIIYSWTGTQYGQPTINIIGDYNIENSSLAGAARIFPTYNDTFAIGVQRAYGGMIFGISIEGQFTTSISDFDTFVNTSFDSISSTRDSQYSPYSGIVIDPFTNGQTVPSPGGYPGLSAWYQGTGSNGGTTAFKISNCNIQGFTVNICNSPNGSTQQGEDCIIELCQLNYAKVAIAYCQSQNDNCFVTGIRSWSCVWTVFDTLSYGPQKGYAPNISRVNIAGIVNTIFNIEADKSFMIDKVYAESFFSMGLVAAGAAGAVIQGSTFNFAISPTNQQPQTHFQSQNIEVNSCTMRYYDDLFNKRLRIIGVNTRFINTFFDLAPYNTLWQSQSQYSLERFENCSVADGVQILGMHNDMYGMSTAQFTPILYGNFKLQSGLGLDVYGSGGNPTAPTITFDYKCTGFNRVIGFATNVNITPDSSRSATFTSPNYLLAQVNDIVVEDVSKNVLGRISAISGTSITITEIPINIISYTNIYVDLIYYLTAANPIVGDITSGSTSITNVTQIMASYIYPLSAGGFRFDHPAFPKGTYVVSYNSSTQVLTMSANSNKTATRQNF